MSNSLSAPAPSDPQKSGASFQVTVDKLSEKVADVCEFLSALTGYGAGEINQLSHSSTIFSMEQRLEVQRYLEYTIRSEYLVASIRKHT
jgi:hypothetical protein